MELSGAGWDKGFLWYDDSRDSVAAALGRVSTGKSSDFSLILFLKKSLADPGGFEYFERSGRRAPEVKYISTFKRRVLLLESVFQQSLSNSGGCGQRCPQRRRTPSADRNGLRWNMTSLWLTGDRHRRRPGGFVPATSVTSCQLLKSLWFLRIAQLY